MGVVFGERSREVLASMLTLREQEQKKEKKVSFVHLFNPGIKPHLCGLVLEQPHVCMYLAAQELTFVAMVTQLLCLVTFPYYKQQPADCGMYCSWNKGNLIDTINTHICLSLLESGPF